MKNLKLLVVVAIVVVMAMSACGGDKGAAPKPPESTAVSETISNERPAAPTDVKVAEATAVPPDKGQAAQAGEQDLSLDSVSGGLANLKSYKSTIDMRFTGKDAQGQAVESSFTMAEEFTSEPRAQRILWASSEAKGGQPATSTSWETITIGQTSYIISTDAGGAQTCAVVSSSDATPPEQTLSADMWGSVSGASYVNTETVNGVSAKHYAWKDTAFGILGYTGGKGETWVAVDGGYVVKQRIEVTGKGTFLGGTDQEGTSTWEWNVTDANGSFQIQPPEDCESATAGLPIMADAAEQSTFGDTTTYNSPSALADVVSFYKSEMPKAGWQASGTPTELEGLAILEFTKEGSTASVMITWDDSSKKTSVVISMTKK
jgi:hypothetical protein